MNIWIVFIGETLPMDHATRAWRYGLLAEVLAARGHHVTRWAPTFNHAHKKQRYNRDYTFKISGNYTIELLYNRAYQQNISFQRLLSYRQLARSFERRIQNEEPADIIICGMPSPELCLVAVNYGKQENIPVIVDIRDLWPDIFLDIAPCCLEPLARLVLHPLFVDNRIIFSLANSITAISSKYLEWGLTYAGRAKSENDKVFYMGYRERVLPAKEKLNLYKCWENLGVNKQSFICCFVGSINRQFDIECIINAAEYFEKTGENNIQFVICGDGTYLNYYKKLARFSKNVCFPGWVASDEIASLMGLSKLGLAPYSSRAKMSLPNKPFEYFSGGLPVISSLRGELERILADNDCGITYEAGDFQGLVNAIKFMHDNPERRRQMGENARCLFEKYYTAAKVYPEMADHIERIVHDGNCKVVD